MAVKLDLRTLTDGDLQSFRSLVCMNGAQVSQSADFLDCIEREILNRALDREREKKTRRIQKAYSVPTEARLYSERRTHKGVRFIPIHTRDTSAGRAPGQPVPLEDRMLAAFMGDTHTRLERVDRRGSVVLKLGGAR